MLDLSRYKTIHTTSSVSGVKSGRKETVTAWSVVKPTVKPGFGETVCCGCKSIVSLGAVDFRLRCETCVAENCERCYRKLNDEGHCLTCLEVTVATDEETQARIDRGVADVLGNPQRLPLISAEDEYNAYSGGVYEYSVKDDTIAEMRAFDQKNEDDRDVRALTNENGWCRRCYLELAVAEKGRGFHLDCEG